MPIMFIKLGKDQDKEEYKRKRDEINIVSIFKMIEACV